MKNQFLGFKQFLQDEDGARLLSMPFLQCW